jgi:heme/copper-type cytochrome/quinol oxidase subunit 2
MQIIVQAMDQADYDNWVKQQRAALNPSPSPSPASGARTASPSASPSPSPTK